MNRQWCFSRTLSYNDTKLLFFSCLPTTYLICLRDQWIERESAVFNTHVTIIEEVWGLILLLLFLPQSRAHQFTERREGGRKNDNILTPYALFLVIQIGYWSLRIKLFKGNLLSRYVRKQRAVPENGAIFIKKNRNSDIPELLKFRNSNVEEFRNFWLRYFRNSDTQELKKF